MYRREGESNPDLTAVDREYYPLHQWERGPVVASSSLYPNVRGSIPPLGSLGNVSENQFLGSTQAL